LLAPHPDPLTRWGEGKKRNPLTLTLSRRGEREKKRKKFENKKKVVYYIQKGRNYGKF
jgi:hypothetical protein